MKNFLRCCRAAVLCLALVTTALGKASEGGLETTIAPTVTERIISFFRGQYPNVIFRKSDSGGYICQGTAKELDYLASDGIGLGSLKKQQQIRQTFTDLKNAKAMELYSIEPMWEASDERIWFAEYLEGRQVERKMSLSPEQGSQAVSALEKGVYETGLPKLCFEPHHALVALANGHRYFLLICFKCQQVQYYADGEIVLRTTISTSPAKVLDQLLGLPPE